MWTRSVLLCIACFNLVSPLDLSGFKGLLSKNDGDTCNVPFLEKKKNEILSLMVNEFRSLIVESCDDLMYGFLIDITNTCHTVNDTSKIVCNVKGISEKSKGVLDYVSVSIIFHNDFEIIDNITAPGSKHEANTEAYCISMTRTYMESQSNEEAEKDHRNYYWMELDSFTFEPLRNVKKFIIEILLMTKIPFGRILVDPQCFKIHGLSSRSCWKKVEINGKLYYSDPVSSLLEKGTELIQGLLSEAEFIALLPHLLSCNIAQFIDQMAGEAIHFFAEKWLQTMNGHMKRMYVKLSDKIKTFPKMIFVEGFDIGELTFDENAWKTIESNQLPKLMPVESFSVINSELQTIDDGVLDLFQSTKYFNFSNCKLMQLPSVMGNLSSLKVLDLSNNPINYTNNSAFFSSLHGLEVLIISGMVLSEVDEYTFGKHVFAPSLHTLDASSCSISTIENQSFMNLTSLRHLDLSNNLLEILSADVFPKDSPIEVLNLSNNRLIQLLSGSGTFLMLAQVDLSLNNIADFTSVMKLFQNSTHINLHGNKITNWDDETIDRDTEYSCTPDTCINVMNQAKYRSDHVKSVNLSNNQINVLTDAMASDFGDFDTIDLGGNFFDCENCALVKYKDYIALNSSFNIVNFNTTDPLLCSTPRERIGDVIEDVMVDPTLCFTNYLLIAGVPILAISMSLLMIGAAAYIYRWQLKYIFYLLGLHLKHQKNDETNLLCQYDAFVCYSAQDEDWVADQLQETLESTYSYKLCLHQRDFLPGKLIKDNIVNAISQSKLTLLILSRDFIESEWCMWELQIADTQIFNREIVIIKLQDDIQIETLSDNLRAKLESKSYIDWPQNPKGHKLFWRKLEQALGKPLSMNEIKT